MKLEKYKYNFHDYHDDERRLPADINDVLRSAVKTLECNELNVLIDRIQNKKLYGVINVYDDRAIQIAKVDFQRGICKKYDIVFNAENPIIKKPIHAIFLQSERNYMVSFKGTKNIEQN